MVIKSDDELMQAKAKITELQGNLDTAVGLLQNQQKEDKMRARSVSVELALRFATANPTAVTNQGTLISVATDLFNYITS